MNNIHIQFFTWVDCQSVIKSSLFQPLRTISSLDSTHRLGHNQWGPNLDPTRQTKPRASPQSSVRPLNFTSREVARCRNLNQLKRSLLQRPTKPELRLAPSWVTTPVWPAFTRSCSGHSCCRRTWMSLWAKRRTKATGTWRSCLPKSFWSWTQ